MSQYQSPDDRDYTDILIKSALKESTAFMNLKHTAERDDGAIPVKYRELISVAVALTTQCAYCIESHIENAVKAGVIAKKLRKPCSSPRRFVRAARLEWPACNAFI